MSEKRYQDLEHLLYRGFIPLKIQVNGVNFVFKSVNENEYEKIKLMSGLESDPKYLSYFNINYLFYSIFMVDGMNILPSREDYYLDFVSVLQQYPAVFYTSIFSHLEELSKRQNDCSIQVEQYSYENESRFNWKFRKNYNFTSPEHTSIKGTDLLGLNQFQKYWAVLNIREDQKESFEERYSLFKFLASFTDPKAVKKIDAQDKVKKEEEEERKERLRVMGTEEELKYLSSPADTREGIINELEKQMRGEKDDHDRIIEEYEKSIRRETLRKMSDLQRVREERRKQLEDVMEETKAISKQELAERLQRLKKRKDNMQYSEVTGDQSAKFYQMSNIKDDELIREEDFLTAEEYEKLTGDEVYRKMSGLTEEDEKEKIEKEYQRQQRTLASKYNLEDEMDMDFPHLKDKKE